MIHRYFNNPTYYFPSPYFKDHKKEVLLGAFDKISADTRVASTTQEFDSVLDQLSEIDSLYQTHLKSHSFFMRCIMNFCWWKTSAHGSYLHCRRSLIGRVAAGYENKMLTLLTCKYILRNKSYRLFCDEALKQAIANTHRKKDIRGFVWQVINSKGVTSYLIGTIHQGTWAMGQAKGVMKAIESSEKFFTEKGLLYSWWRSSYFPLMTLDWRFFFILDRYIALEARRKNKENFALDNCKLERNTDRIVKKIRRKNPESPSIKLIQETSKDCFTVQELKIDNNHPIVSEIEKIYLPQSINLWQKGNESEEIKFNQQFFRKDTYASADLRTKAWLKKSFESHSSEKALPGLIQQIQEANKPICIAVGHAHCIGSKVSLVEELRKAGFEVSRFE